MLTKNRITLSAIVLLAAIACGKKKSSEDAPKAQARIAFAVYQVGLFDTVDAKKASEWLNRGEMVTVLETLNVPDAKDPKKSRSWAKIERTTGKQGFVDSANVESKAFVTVGPLEVFNINQASGKKIATVPAGQVGFVSDEKADWVKVRFGYKIFENWSGAADAIKWADGKWAQLSQVSYDPAAIGQGIELETAMRKFNEADAAKKAQGQKELEKIVADGTSQFVEVARRALDGAQAAPAAEPAAAPAATENNP
ncbi:MAG: hypothetical protein ACOY5B_06395 [Spirochaetota bacterium]